MQNKDKQISHLYTIRPINIKRYIRYTNNTSDWLLEHHSSNRSLVGFPQTKHYLSMSILHFSKKFCDADWICLNLYNNRNSKKKYTFHLQKQLLNTVSFSFHLYQVIYTHFCPWLYLTGLKSIPLFLPAVPLPFFTGKKETKALSQFSACCFSLTHHKMLSLLHGRDICPKGTTLET